VAAGVGQDLRAADGHRDTPDLPVAAARRQFQHLRQAARNAPVSRTIHFCLPATLKRA
jgi:hypothetical protein